MPGFVSMGDTFGDAKEATTAPAGVYDLRVTDVSDHLGQSGSKSTRVTVEFVGHPEYSNIRTYLGMTDPERDAQTDAEKGREPGTTSRFKQMQVKRFLHLFGVKWDKKGYDPNKLYGKTARCEVQLEVPGDNAPPNARPQNRINTPYLPDGVS